jgi:hypothetical protein
MHDNTWRAYGGPGRKGDSGDGGVRSHQVPSKVQGGAGNACEGRHGGCMEVHGTSSLIHGARTALGVAETALHAQLAMHGGRTNGAQGWLM